MLKDVVDHSCQPNMGLQLLLVKQYCMLPWCFGTAVPRFAIIIEAQLGCAMKLIVYKHQ